MAKEKSALQKLRERYVSETGKFKGEAGTGERFRNCVRYQMQRLGISEERARALCSQIGRWSYGKAQFQKMAAAGRKK